MRLEREVSANTLDSYLSDIKQYIDFIRSKNISDIRHTTNTTVLSYMLCLEKDNMAPATIHRKLSSLRSYYRYLLLNHLIETDPTNKLNMPKNKRKIPKTLTIEETNRLLSQPQGDDYKSIRDKAMLELLYATGIRVSELISLNLDDINTEVGWVKCGQAHRERVIPIAPEVRMHIKRYLKKARSELVKDNKENAFFVNTHGKRMSRQGFWKIIKQYKDKAQIDKEITPYTLRHSLAVHLMVNDADIQLVKEMLGHADITTTQIYRKIHMENNDF